MSSKKRLLHIILEAFHIENFILVARKDLKTMCTKQNNLSFFFWFENLLSLNTGLSFKSHFQHFYTTKGRDRFHWAVPYKVGNICYMTYKYIVLYFLNCLWNIFFLQKTAIFVKISKSGDGYRSVFERVRACPIDVLSNRR